MSKKHVDEYFNSVVSNYKEMLDALHDLEEECSTGLVDPDMVEQMKTMIKPIKENYMTLSWIMFLFNMPNKKEKKKKYEKEMNPLMRKIDPNKTYTPENILKNNKETIKDLSLIFK